MARILGDHADWSNVELGRKLGVSESYVRKLRNSGWRPARVSDHLLEVLRRVAAESDRAVPVVRELGRTTYGAIADDDLRFAAGEFSALESMALAMAKTAGAAKERLLRATNHHGKAS